CRSQAAQMAMKSTAWQQVDAHKTPKGGVLAPAVSDFGKKMPKSLAVPSGDVYFHTYPHAARSGTNNL
ncbi:MAG: hypothetical protein NC246_15460, partial [Muribaculaceae bacterium]|nr:hypothetical protein [Muribaculaceae bacterium]